MLDGELLAKFLQLFAELDGLVDAQDPKVTRACISALFDRMVNPPEAGDDLPTDEDITRTAQAITTMVEDEAERVRQVIRDEC